MELLDIVGKQSPLSNKYIPMGLICEPIANTWIIKEVYYQFYELNRALQKAGLSSLRMVTGYRSYEYQKMLYNGKVRELLLLRQNRQLAVQEAQLIVMPPGYSEHQLGSAIDVTTAALLSADVPLKEFERTMHFKWLLKNSSDYGFILRYPRHKVDLTGVTFKPYHYRYVGINHAKKMQRLNVCLEEYVTEHIHLRS